MLQISPALKYTVLGSVAVHLIIASTTFDQLWYVHDRGFERAHIAQVTGWIGVTGGVLSTFFGGIGSDWWTQHRRGGRTGFFFWVMLVLTPLNIAYRLVEPGSFLFWLGVFSTYFTLGAFYGPVFSAVQELVLPEIRGTVVALLILANSVVGVGIGVSAAGFAIDHLVGAGVVEPYTAVVLALTLLSTGAIPGFHLAASRFERDRDTLRLAVTEGLSN